MAYVIDDKKEDTSTVSSTPLSSGPQPAAQSTPEQSTAPTPVTQTAPQSQQPSQSSNKPKSSSSGMFTNIQKYVQKNKPQSQKMAQESRNYVQEADQKAKAATDTALTGFKEQTEASGLHNTQDRVNELTAYTEQQAGVQQPAQPEASITDAVNDPMNDIPVSTAKHPNGIPVAGVDTAPPAQPNKIDESQFRDTINAKYTGPMSLVQTGNLYNDLAKQAKDSARVGELAQSTAGRGQLLKDMYTSGTNLYGSGQSNLDSYLLGKQGGALKDIISSGQQIGSQQDIIKNASNQAIGQAKATSDLVAGTRDQARKAFADVANQRQGEIDNRVNAVVENWDNLPNHFKKIFEDADGKPNLSALEAGMLGIKQGEGMYKLGADDLFAKEGEEGYINPEVAKLISQQESGNLQRLQALSNMAKTGKNGLYNVEDSRFSDTDLAGTQSSLDALNTDHIRNKLIEAEEGFRGSAAQNTKGKGKGWKSYWDGPWWNETWETEEYNAQATGNLKDVLSKAGYDFNTDINTENIANKDILKNMSSVLDNSEKKTMLTGLPGAEEALEAVDDAKDLFTGDSSEILEALNMDYNDLIGTDIAKNVLEGIGGKNNMFADGVGKIGEITNKLGNMWAGDPNASKEAKKIAEAQAKQNAAIDLQKKLQAKFDNSGFNNRVGIVDNDETKQRWQDLVKLMSGIDKTNMNDE